MKEWQRIIPAFDREIDERAGTVSAKASIAVGRFSSWT